MLELEQKVLAAMIASRRAYEDLQALLDEGDLTEVGRYIARTVGKYYARDNDAASVDKQLLLAMLEKAAPSPKQCDALREAVNGLPPDVSAHNVVGVYRDLHARNILLKSVDAAIKGDPKAKELMRQYLDAADEGGDEDEPDQLDPDALFAERHDKMRVHPPELNERLYGGVRPSETALIFGRPGMGKTLLTTNIVAGFAHDGHKGLYVGNEESSRALHFRFLSRLGTEKLEDLNHMDRAKARAHAEAAYKKAHKHGMQNVHIRTGASSMPQIRSWVEKLKPRWLVLDQVRNVGMGGEGMTQNLELVARELRVIADECQLFAIGVSQAAASADNKIFLSLLDLDSSKTGAQGACDLMLGVGADVAMLEKDSQGRNQRGIAICRNKVSGVFANFKVTVNESYTQVVTNA